jgi:hypothetical protein
MAEDDYKSVIQVVCIFAIAFMVAIGNQVKIKKDLTTKYKKVGILQKPTPLFPPNPISLLQQPFSFYRTAKYSSGGQPTSQL